MIRKIGFVGAGAAATALATALQGAGYRISGVASRGPSASRLATALGVRRYTPDKLALSSELILLAVPDDSIASVAKSVAWPADTLVAHVSGSRTLDPLQPAAASGARIGAFHPMQAFAGAQTLNGVTFGIEGDDEVYAELAEIALAVGGRPLRLTEDQKALYHLSGAMMSNLLVALAWAASGLWERAGLVADRREALGRLLPLIDGTARNLEKRGLPTALTGPVARGDGGTIRRHIRALEEDGSDEMMRAYHALTEIAVEVALARGLDRIAAERVTDALREVASLV